jgi:chromatin segregation and condensation protein Rec8/ScpA/Scc1 (kleisin family)
MRGRCRLPLLAAPFVVAGHLASTLVAGLELARAGAITLKQHHPFGPI